MSTPLAGDDPRTPARPPGRAASPGNPAGSVLAPPRRLAALAGVLAGGAGLAVAELVAAGLGVRQTPVVAIGQAFISVVPGWLERLAIDLLGTADKPALLIGVLVVFTALAAGIGIVAAAARRTGIALVGVVGLLAAVVSATRPDAGPTAALPGLVAGLVAALLLPWLLSRFAGTVGADGALDSEGRRALLLNGGVVVLGSVLAGAAARWWGGTRTTVESARSTLPLPLPKRDTVLQPPAGAELASKGAEGLSPWRTDNETFYLIHTALREPLIEPESWRLRIHGMVDRPMTLTLRELVKRPIVHRWVTLACVSNEVGGDLIGNALWSGVRIDELLREVGVRPEADAVKSTSEDGWTCGTPLSALTDGRDSLLAFGMNGAALPVEHGFPVRMVVPGLYGFVSATKWLVDIEVSRFDRFDAFWTPRGWSEQAPVKTASRIDVPRGAARVSAGSVVVAGVAWAQHRGISGVEVQVDDGDWQPAKLAGQPTKDSWRQWTWDWDAEPGRHTLRVRATDGTDEVQTADVAPPAPNGSSGYHAVEVEVT